MAWGDGWTKSNPSRRVIYHGAYLETMSTGSKYMKISTLQLAGNIAITLPRNGSIVSISAHLKVNTLTTQGTIIAEAVLNGATSFQAILNIDSTDFKYWYETQDKDIDIFNEGDRLGFRIKYGTFEGQCQGMIVCVEVEFDT